MEINIPWLILMDSTSACNLHCAGCWAAEYGNRLNLTFEERKEVGNLSLSISLEGFDEVNDLRRGTGVFIHYSDANIREISLPDT